MVSDWKAERSQPGLDQLFRIASYGRTTIDWLLSGKGPMQISIAFDGKTQDILGSTERQAVFRAADASGISFMNALNALVRDGVSVRGGFLPEDNSEAELVLRPVMKLRKAPRDRRIRYICKLLLLLAKELQQTPRVEAAPVLIQETEAELEAAANELHPNWKATLDLDYPEQKKAGKRKRKR